MSIYLKEYPLTQPDKNEAVLGQTKPALVMLHGWSMHSGLWQTLAEQLAQHFRVICLDLPGHGLSGLCAPYQLETVTDILLQAIPTEQFMVLGWSLGASIALDMAWRYPKRVSRVITLAGNPCFVEQNDWPGVHPNVLMRFSENLMHDSHQTLVRFLALQVNGLPEGKHLLRQLKTAIESCPPPTVEALQGGLKILQTCDLRDELAALSQPVLAIFGDHDKLIPPVLAKVIKQRRPDCQISLLAGAGHAPFLTHSEHIQQAIIQFVDDA
ncbi:pimeloyl-ACP methyl ester esterase BioH [methane-oxidizing endosymbiont of Gigantopelta aegis]|uniref:pimeloyl-ACP methyl ester esterase BioH n=1 Tax=methane-oxidizing endosymbiont of Gigantopelta aegis TaxID=2794938 RepID=UPI0018DAFD67|nr:pimeloyl-ACP methyl ester esterase BioH [methane-oxidizing endosymbiont of Gigantopelta aegis]